MLVKTIWTHWKVKFKFYQPLTPTSKGSPGNKKSTVPNWSNTSMCPRFLPIPTFCWITPTQLSQVNFYDSHSPRFHMHQCTIAFLNKQKGWGHRSSYFSDHFRCSLLTEGAQQAQLCLITLLHPLLSPYVFLLDHFHLLWWQPHCCL